jgi:multiple sugar transport system permease protein
MSELAPPTQGGTPAEARAAWLLLAPALGAIALFFAVPVVAALVLSLTDFDLYALADPRNTRFVGADNYARLLRDPLFWRALRVTAVFVVLGVPLTLAASLGGALLVHSRLARLRGLWRTVFFAPVVTTLVAVAVVWRYLYQPRYGLINQLLGRFGIPPIDWLGDPVWAMVAITLLSVWRSFGYGLVIFVAGLGAIPESMYEAASLDGASKWRQFLGITLPLLRPTTLFVAVITTVGFFQIFAEPYVMTRGGPLNATTSIALLMYQQGFRWWNMGRAAAIAFVLFALILSATGLQVALRRVARPRRGGTVRRPPAPAEATAEEGGG